MRCALVAMVVTLGTVAFADGAKRKMAVPEFEVRGGIQDKTVGALVADLVLARLSEKYALYERTLLKKLLEERSLRESDLAAAKPEALKALHLEGVQWLVLGHVARLESRYVVGARVVDSASGELLGKGEIAVDSLDDLPDHIGELLKKMGLEGGAVKTATGGFTPYTVGRWRVVGRWRPLPITGAPGARWQATAVLCGDRVVIWGGYDGKKYLGDGARFDVVKRVWEPVSGAGAPSGRAYHSAVWTGKELLIWGGKNESGYLSDGAAYDPARDVWRPLPASPLGARCAHAAVWTGGEMLIWGGKGRTADGRDVYYRSGAAYDPARGEWRPLSNEGDRPQGRLFFAYGFARGRLVVWGGRSASGKLLGTGAAYDVRAGKWRRMSDADAPRARARMLFCTSAAGVVVWGGDGADGVLSDGAIYDAGTDSWRALSAGDALPHLGGGAVACGEYVVFWSGLVDGVLSRAGRAYHLKTGRWCRVPASTAPPARGGYAAVWCRGYMLVFGGWTLEGGKRKPVGNGGILAP